MSNSRTHGKSDADLKALVKTGVISMTDYNHAKAQKLLDEKGGGVQNVMNRMFDRLLGSQVSGGSGVKIGSPP